MTGRRRSEPKGLSPSGRRAPPAANHTPGAPSRGPAAPAGPEPATPWAWLLDRAGPLGLAVLAGTLVLLLAHAASYVFLADDAFISFRYARNLAHGHGLVFNPGFEHVEGYSNFLWVLILAAFERIGLAPERMSHVLSLAATVALWGLVAWFSLRGGRTPRWVAVVPALLLAATRSVAVWSTSGLETRLFETLAVGGALRLLVELEARLGGRAPRSLAAWLFGLAALTRPDGLLVAGCALGVAGLVLRLRRPAAFTHYVKGLAPFVALVAAQFAFRLVYYGDLLPNTYYAKVGGRAWWSSGWHYLGAFALEYAAYLWIPLLAAAWTWHRRRDTLHVPFVFAAIVLPHALYVASIGGDHFEYRPLDLYFPLAFLLIGDGARQWLDAARGARARSLAVAGWLALTLGGLWQLPSASRAQAPDTYIPGFPGWALNRREARAFLDPARDPVYQLPVLRAIAETHRGWVRDLTRHFVALRQEEHRAFLETVAPEGRRLRELVHTGVLPRDLHVAIACVGAIPYYSDLRTFDRLGLTDREVAHGPFRHQDFMAHDKIATIEQARDRDVDAWALEGVHVICNVTSNCMLAAVREVMNRPGAYHAADVGGGDYLMAILPQGEAAAAARMPGLRFRAMNDPAFLRDYLDQGIAAYRERLGRDPDDPETRYELAYLLLARRDFDAARVLFEGLADVRGDRFELWVNLSQCYEGLGDATRAREARAHAVTAAERNGDDWALPGLRRPADSPPGAAGR